MTTQETDEQIAARLLATLRQRTTAAREWERQAGEWRASLQAERAAHEVTKGERDGLRKEIEQVLAEAEARHENT